MNALITYNTYQLKAYITLLDKNNGRTKPIASGYRPSFSFNTKNLFSGEINLHETTSLLPSQSTYAFINLLPAKTIPNNLKIGDSFTMYEGKKIVGMGIIVDKLHKQEVAEESIFSKL